MRRLHTLLNTKSNPNYSTDSFLDIILLLAFFTLPNAAKMHLVCSVGLVAVARIRLSLCVCLPVCLSLSLSCLAGRIDATTAIGNNVQVF